MTGTFCCLALRHDGGRRGRVHRIEHQHVGAVGEGGLGLGLLHGGVLVGVVVDDLALGAEGALTLAVNSGRSWLS